MDHTIIVSKAYHSSEVGLGRVLTKRPHHYPKLIRSDVAVSIFVKQTKRLFELYKTNLNTRLDHPHLILIQNTFKHFYSFSEIFWMVGNFFTTTFGNISAIWQLSHPVKDFTSI